MNADNLGVGVMIGLLGGNEDSVTTIEKSLNKTIKTVRLVSDKLEFEFVDGFKMSIADEGQSCCEHRYMMTDDKLEDYDGAILLGLELKNAPNIEDECGTHEVQFLEIKTSNGSFTMATHNEHNGYYGGFWIVATEQTA